MNNDIDNFHAVYALDLLSGRVLWEFPTHTRITASVVASGAENVMQSHTQRHRQRHAKNRKHRRLVTHTVSHNEDTEDGDRHEHNQRNTVNSRGAQIRRQTDVQADGSDDAYEYVDIYTWGGVHT